MKSDNDENNDSVNELNPNYNRIHIFNSFEEQEEHRLKTIAKQDPVERVKETVQLILRIYSLKENKKPKNYHDIFIDKV